MRALGRTIFIGIVLLALAPPGAGAQPRGSLAKGQLIRGQQDETIGGWLWSAGGLYATRTTRDHVTTEAQACCFALLTRGDQITVARTVAVETNARGGVTLQRVLDTMTIRRAAAEDVVDCGPLWIVPALSLKDRRTKLVRSVVVADAGFSLLTWKDGAGTCDHHE